jgi:NAD+ synthase (glutamine-hydrolysing)
VQVISATIDLDQVRSYRASIPSFGMQARDYGADYVKYHDVRMISNSQLKTTKPLETIRFHSPEEECCLGPACWLWDYLRRSGAAGFFLPLSGGADSASVATIVGVMCHLVTAAAKDDPEVAKECRRVCRQDDDWIPSTPQEMANCVLHTTFMGTDNSSQATESRAKRLGDAIGSYHSSIKIDLMVSAVIQVFSFTTGKTPQFTSQGGTMAEDLALQNIQARLRMVTAYLFAQLLPWVRGRSGFLLVLGSANVDEGLRGYMTKYDCSSADLNPIGGMSKGDLKRMLLWAAARYPTYHVLSEIAGAPPTAELRPMMASSSSSLSGGNDDDETVEHSQLDEEEMGMSYDELGMFGRLRKMSRCGPVAMFRRLYGVEWSHLSPRVVADKVQKFFFYYSINRHKMCTITPAYHAEGYSPDDNRFDLRQFLYNASWTRQFRVMNELVAEYDDEAKEE